MINSQLFDIVFSDRGRRNLSSLIEKLGFKKGIKNRIGVFIDLVNKRSLSGNNSIT